MQGCIIIRRERDVCVCILASSDLTDTAWGAPPFDGASDEQVDDGRVGSRDGYGSTNTRHGATNKGRSDDAKRTATTGIL